MDPSQPPTIPDTPIDSLFTIPPSHAESITKDPHCPNPDPETTPTSNIKCVEIERLQTNHFHDTSPTPSPRAETPNANETSKTANINISNPNLSQTYSATYRTGTFEFYFNFIDTNYRHFLSEFTIEILGAARRQPPGD
jgi:hypothetical protein